MKNNSAWNDRLSRSSSYASARSRTLSRSSSTLSNAASPVPNAPSALRRLNLRKGLHRFGTIRRDPGHVSSRTINAPDNLRRLIIPDYIPQPSAAYTPRPLMKRIVLNLHDVLDSFARLQSRGQGDLVWLLQHNFMTYVQHVSLSKVASRACRGTQLPWLSKVLESSPCVWSEDKIRRGTYGSMRLAYTFIATRGLTAAIRVLMLDFVQKQLDAVRVRGISASQLSKLLKKHHALVRDVLLGKSPRGGLRPILVDLVDMAPDDELERLVAWLHSVIPYALLGDAGNANKARKTLNSFGLAS